MKLVLVPKGSTVVSAVRPDATIAIIQSSTWDAAMQAYWDAHDLYDVSDGEDVEVGDTCVDGVVTLAPARADDKTRIGAGRALLAAIKDIGDGTSALTAVQRERALAKAVAFLMIRERNT